MALDRVLLGSRAAGESPTLRFLQFAAPSLLVGCHQQLDREVRLDFWRERGLEVNRRITAGALKHLSANARNVDQFGPGV
jgi:lipoate-protein ligase A